MWFRHKPKGDPADAVRSLREQALTVGAAELGLAPTAARPHVWGVLMETGYSEAVATLVVLADGTTSLYFSNGGGIIGGGQHAIVRAAAEAFLSAAEDQHSDLAEALATPLPELGEVKFYVRTYNGTLGAGANEQDLGESRHHLSPLFHAGHAVIDAVREFATSR